jgi:hypothetical protein
VTIDLHRQGAKAAEHFRLIVIGSQINAQVIALEALRKEPHGAERLRVVSVQDGDVFVAV